MRPAERSVPQALEQFEEGAPFTGGPGLKKGLACFSRGAGTCKFADWRNSKKRRLSTCGVINADL